MKRLPPRYTFSNETPGQYRRFFQKNCFSIIKSPSVETLSNSAGTDNHGSYKHLLFDPRWRAKREEMIKRDDGKCVICGNNEKLQVHHRQYHFLKSLKKFKAPWDYRSDLLVTLCETCHSKGHSNYKVPTVYI